MHVYITSLNAGLLNTAVQPGQAGIGQQLAGANPTGNGFLNILGALTKRLTQASKSLAPLCCAMYSHLAGVRNILSAGSGSAGAAAKQVIPQFCTLKPYVHNLTEAFSQRPEPSRTARQLPVCHACHRTWRFCQAAFHAMRPVRSTMCS